LSVKRALNKFLAALFTAFVVVTIVALLPLVGIASFILAQALRNCNLNIATNNNRSSIAYNALAIAL
jgi:hypothetical protein